MTADTKEGNTTLLSEYRYNNIKNHKSATLNRETFLHRLISTNVDKNKSLLKSSTLPGNLTKLIMTKKEDNKPVSETDVAKLNENETKRSEVENARNAFLTMQLKDENKIKKTAPPSSARRVSFRVRSGVPTHRRTPSVTMTMLRPNRVAQLAVKFNQMVQENNILEEPRIAKAVKRVSNVTINEEKLTTPKRKNLIPSELHGHKKKPSLKHKPSVKSNSKQDIKHAGAVVAKIKHLDTPKSILKTTDPPKTDTGQINVHKKSESKETDREGDKSVSIKKRTSMKRNPSFKTYTRTPGNVKAAIQIFEQKNSNVPTTQTVSKAVQLLIEPTHKEVVPKPKVPDKTDSVVKTKQIVYKNGLPLLKDLSKSEIKLKEKKIEDEVQKQPKVSTSSPENIIINNIENTQRKDTFLKSLIDDNTLTNNKSNIEDEKSAVHIEPKELDIKIEKDYETNKEKAIKNSKLTPNRSFLWRSKSKESLRPILTPYEFSDSLLRKPKKPVQEDENVYDVVGASNVQMTPTDLLAKIQLDKGEMKSETTQTDDEGIIDFKNILDRADTIINTFKLNLNSDTVDDDYEPLTPIEDQTWEVVTITNKEDNKVQEDNAEEKYEYCTNSSRTYEDLEESNSGYEYCKSPKEENIYEKVPLRKFRSTTEPLPPKPDANYDYQLNDQEYESIYSTIESNKANESDIYNTDDGRNMLTISESAEYSSSYECVYTGDTGSTLSCDMKSNSLYAGQNSVIVTGSESSASDDWVDVSETEDITDEGPGLLIVRERAKERRLPKWSHIVRDQWEKRQHNSGDGDSDHVYESLHPDEDEPYDEDYDSFESDSESDSCTQHDSGVDIANNRLPPPPPTVNIYAFTKFAARATRQMRLLKRNWSLTKNDISKSLSRMTKKLSTTELAPPNRPPPPIPQDLSDSASNEIPPSPNQDSITYDSSENVKDKRRKYWPLANKFRRSLSSSSENVGSGDFEKRTRSTFYLFEAVNVDTIEKLSNEKLGNNLASSECHFQSSKVILRPSNPPPAPPISIANSDKNEKRCISLYTPNDEKAKLRSTTFWYAEIGLYQNGNNSIEHSSSNEDSGSSFTSSSTAPIPNNNIIEFNAEGSEIQKRLMDEPLYQFYNAAVVESGMRELRSDSWESSDANGDGYERVGDSAPYQRPSAMELAANKARSLWCEVPEVIDSAVLSTLNTHQKKLQEAKFELITSEASYLNSLTVLCNHFIAQLENNKYMTDTEASVLFSNIRAVKQCSEKLLEDMEACWQNNILLIGICDVIRRHAENNFSVYVTFCENQIYLDRTLRKLKERKGPFVEKLSELESSPACHSLPLHSFLMLPMQRITRLPLLADAILKRLNAGDDEYEACQFALATLNKVVSQCNEGARHVERQDEFQRNWSLLEFSRDISEPAAAQDVSRWLERSGELIQLVSRGDDTKLTFGKKFIKTPLHFFLFTDLLVITKRKSEECYTVLHHCPRSFVEVNLEEALAQSPVKDAAGKNILFVTLLENHEHKMVEMLLTCASESDRTRWVEALRPSTSQNPDETLYERWDCPQVAALHSYIPRQPDELPLQPGDVVNVTRKMADGWYQGERIRDGRSGWFPGNHVTEIANAHVRARNLKQRYRLLALSGSYLESQRKNKG